MRIRLIAVAAVAATLLSVGASARAANPTITITSPEVGAALAGQVPVTWASSGFLGNETAVVEVNAGSGFAEVARAPVALGVATWDTTALSDGTDYVLRVSVGNRKDVVDLLTVDNTAPTIDLAGRDPLPNAAGWSNADVTLTWACTDAGSGVVDDTVAVTLSDEGAGQSASATCVDRAGNEATDAQGGIDIDRTAPVAAVVSPAAGLVLPTDGITGTAADGLSGVAGVTVSVTNALGDTTELDGICGEDGCATWSASVDGLLPGLYDVQVSAADLADNAGEPSEPVTLVIV